MLTFGDESIKKQLTPFGKAVKKAFIDKNIKANQIIKQLNEEGFKIEKTQFSYLLYGRGIRKDVIKRVAEILDIVLIEN